MKNWIEITTIIGCKNMCIYCPQDKLLKSYKDSKKILDLIGPTVDVKLHIKPLYNFKAGE